MSLARRFGVVLLSWFLGAALTGCGDDEPPPPSRPTPPSPTAGVESPALAALLTEHWELEMTLRPFAATFYGERRFDAQLPPVRRDEVLALRQRRRDLLARAQALDPAGLGAADRVTRAVLVERLVGAAGLDVCDYERWAVTVRRNPIASFDSLGDVHLLLDDDDAASYLARVEAMPAAIDVIGAELVAGAASGLVATRQSLLAVSGLLQVWADRMPHEWPLLSAIEQSHLRAGARDDLSARVSELISTELAPAYRRLASALDTEVLPSARTIEGLPGIPAGAACYDAEIRRHTTLPMTAAELHALGLSEVARIEAEIVALGGQLYGAGSLAEVRTQLQADASQRFSSEKELLEWVRGIIARAEEAVAPLFDRLPSTPLELEPYPASFGQVAASYQWSPDGIQPAIFFLVTQPPQNQARWSLEAVTYHEAIPGHHLQIGRLDARDSLPALRVEFNDTAYSEGWGLYAETLADEIGLYTSEAARLGRLANEALRACRLVVDTGLHAQGWTRDEAEEFMELHSMFTGGFVVSEVERYLQTPGQALAYKVGELELLRLRAEVRTRRGAAFSLRDFHEAVLTAGSLPLPVLAGELLGSTATAAGTPSGEALAAHGGGWRVAK